MTVSPEEERLIKKRLITQTTTARPGADPPVKKLAKRYISFCNSVAQGNADVAEVGKNREEFLRELAHYEFQLGRMKSVVVANKRELVSYAEAKTQVEASISATRDEIEALKVELDAARLERQHKEEYEALRRLCMEFPSRAETAGHNAQLEREIEDLEKESEATASTLELRKKQFALLLHVVNELQDELEDEKEKDAAGGGVGEQGSAAVKDSKGVAPMVT